MNNQLRSVYDQVLKLGGGSRAIALLSALALVGVVVAGLWLARRPHFELLYSNLDELESPAIQKALADASVDYEVSQPPGPFSIYVDSSQRRTALKAVGSSGALARAPQGISGEKGGMPSIFMSSGEREQVMRKNEWEECEMMLEELAFVNKAIVRTTVNGSTPFGRPVPIKASVVLQLRGAQVLTREQGRGVASLVRFCLGVEPQNLVVGDQGGHVLYDGSATEGDGASDWLEARSQHDAELTQSVNQLLASILGDGLARVVVRSEWNSDQVAEIEQSANPKERVAYSEENSSTSTPQAGDDASKHAAGISETISQGFGVTNLGVDDKTGTGAGGPPADGGAPSEPVARTEDKKTEYIVPQSTKTTLRMAPVLKRLSVSLLLDASLAEQKTALEKSVKAAVGFDESRKDVFVCESLTFVKPPEGSVVLPDGTVISQDEVESAPSPWMELILQRGVELLAAGGFLVVAFSALRPGKKKKKAGPASGKALAPGAPASATQLDDGEEQVDSETLAKAQAAEMVRAQPERVGRILSNWARQQRETVKAG